MDDTLKAVLAGWIRHGLTVGAGALGLDSYLTQDWYTAVAAAVMTILAASWSAWQKSRTVSKGATS